MHPYQNLATAPPVGRWQLGFAPQFAWIAEHDPGFFRQLTYAETRQNATCAAMLRAWTSEQVGNGSIDLLPLHENLSTLTLLQQHTTGHLGRDEFVAQLVDHVRPPWAQKSVGEAFTPIDPALAARIGAASDVFDLATALVEVLDRNDGPWFDCWAGNVETLANQVVDANLPYFTAFASDCDDWTQHLRAGLAGRAPATPPPSTSLDGLHPEHYRQLLESYPNLVEPFTECQHLVQLLETGGCPRSQLEGPLLQTIDILHRWYATYQPVVLRHLETTAGTPAGPNKILNDGLAAHYRQVAREWEALRQAGNTVGRQLDAGFVEYPAAPAGTSGAATGGTTGGTSGGGVGLGPGQVDETPLDYLHPEPYPNVLADHPELNACVNDYNSEAYEFNEPGRDRSAYRQSALAAVEQVYACYVRGQPPVLWHLREFGGAPGQAPDPMTAHFQTLAREWESLRQACEAIAARLQDGRSGYPPVPPAAPDDSATHPDARTTPGDVAGAAGADLTDEQWELIQPLLPTDRSGTYHRRTIIDAMMYQHRTRCRWGDLPARYPPARTVLNLQQLLRRAGTLDLIRAILD